MRDTYHYLAPLLNGTEDALRWLWPECTPRFPFRFIWGCRFYLTEGRTRRKLRRAVKEWSRNHFQSVDHFHDYDLGKDLKGRTIVVEIRYVDEHL